MSRPARAARRWPDLLIGVLVVLLLVGFGLLLFRPETRTATSGIPSASPAASTGTSSIPSAPTAAQTTTNAQSGASSTSEPPTIAAAPVETTPPVSASPAPAPSSSGTASQPQTTTATPRTGGAVATSEQRVPLRSDYRITLGTFSSAQAATTAAAPVSALGYTVYPIDLGSQVVVQVGPFADETTARQALADIQRAYPSALLYPPRNRSLTQGSASGTTSGTTSTGTSSNSTSAPASTSSAATATPAPASSGPIYLQVGAFNRVESAQKLVQQLRGLGYAPTVNAPEGKKVTVLVGPFTGDAVTRTEQRLSTSGLDHFRVR